MDNEPKSNDTHSIQSDKECLEKECVQRECLERKCVQRECLEKECVQRECLEKECVQRECLEKERVQRECIEKECVQRECLEKECVQNECIGSDTQYNYCRPSSTASPNILKGLSNEQQLQMIFDAADDLIAIIDMDHRIVRINAPMARRLGCTPEEASGKFCYEIVHNMTSPPDFCPHAKLILSGTKEIAEGFEDNLGGNLRITVTPIEDENGKIIGSVHVARDINQAKQMEEAVALSEKTFSMLFEENRDAILWADTQGYIIKCNGAAAKLFDCSREELLGIHQTSLHPPDKKKRYRELFIQNIKAKKHLNVEVEIITGKGMIRYVNLISTIIEVDGKEINQGIFVDITDDKRAQEDLTREMAVNRALADIASTLTPPCHEAAEDAPWCRGSRQTRRQPCLCSMFL
ncbi:MAG: PAS domain S-box protein [Desulfamplus sp.]|nr:PAS domain S-box protein [Desulfamplus sp.]